MKPPVILWCSLTFLVQHQTIAWTTARTRFHYQLFESQKCTPLQMSKNENGAINGEPVNGDTVNGAPVNRDSNDDEYPMAVSGYTTEGYSQFLRAKREYLLQEENEDGYGVEFTFKHGWMNRLAGLPLGVIKSAAKRIVKNKAKNPKPGTLILVRHGESEWNANKTFTGWADPDLNNKGFREAEHAARLLLEGGYEIDVVFTSRLKRAIRSCWIILQELNEVYLPVYKSWRLNERMYGALTGLSKTETAQQLGTELVQAWRGSLKSRPPALERSDVYWPGRDRKYFDLTQEQIPMTESLLDCMERTAPVWQFKIKKEIQMGRNVMVVAHANTLRGLVKTIDEIGDDEIQEVAIPTGIPIIYKFDKDMNPIPPSSRSNQTVSQLHMKGLFLEKPGVLKQALKQEEEWRNRIPGYDSTMGRTKTPMTPLERSLTKLKAERELGQWAGQFIDLGEEEDDGNDGNMTWVEDQVWEMGLAELEEGGQFDPDGPVFHSGMDDNANTMLEGVEDMDEEEDEVESLLVAQSNIINQPCVTSMPSQVSVPGMGDVPVRKDGVLVIIRHGKTEHNKLGLFTGWEDVPLAKDGIVEAQEAGRLLKLHGFEFDVVYTSWLSRAIETAWFVMNEMDCLWLPIIKSWRLNERMYGDLTGLSKRMVAQRHGEAQFKAWRRGYKVRPPKVSSFSPNYPGNDKRYQKYLSDVRHSIRESVIRSIESGEIEIHRKFPKSESLKDCMDRTIPYFSQQIVPEAISQGKRVLISSSENAIRGLLMYLCEIPEEFVTELEIPNGLPLIFDIKSKCLKLLDDGTGRDLLEVYNFGKAGKYLFKPCKNEDGSIDEECDIRYMSDGFRGANGDKTSTPVVSKQDQDTLDALTKRKAQPVSLAEK